MNRLLMALLVASALVVVSLPLRVQGAEPAEQEVFLNTEEMEWRGAPPGLPPGAKIAVLFGDPHNPGPFVMRMMMPARYRVAPHWHGKSESLTVISGRLYLGKGERFEYSHVHPLKQGGYHYLPAGTRHYGFTDTPTVIQIHGEGPFDIIYVNRADDPRNLTR